MEIAPRISKQMHDLMNQMGVLMLQIDMVGVDDQVALQQSSRRLFEELTLLQMLLRIHLGTLKLNRMDLPLCDAPEDAYGRHEALIEGRGGITVEVECDYDAFGNYDRALVVSVLSLALLQGVEAGATELLLTADAAATGGYQFTVEDNRVELPAAESVEGDLDLLVAREIVRIHDKAGEEPGGVIRERSERLGGTRLRLWIR